MQEIYVLFFLLTSYQLLVPKIFFDERSYLMGDKSPAANKKKAAQKVTANSKSNKKATTSKTTAKKK